MCLLTFSLWLKDLLGPSESQQFQLAGKEGLMFCFKLGGRGGTQELAVLSISEGTDNYWTKDGQYDFFLPLDEGGQKRSTRGSCLRIG